MKSPILAAVWADWQAAMQRGDADLARQRVERFWQEQHQRGGGPLVEMVPVAPHRQGAALLAGTSASASFYVTFLWRDGVFTNQRTAQAFNGAITGAEQPLQVRLLAPVRQFNTQVLSPLGRTGIRYYSVVLPADSRMSYQYAAGAQPAEGNRQALRAWMREHTIVDPLNPTSWPSAPVESLQRLPAYAALRPLSVLQVPEAEKPLRSATVEPAAKASAVTALGRWSRHRIKSEVLGNTRDVWLYQMPALANHVQNKNAPPSQATRVWVVLDGEQWETQWSVQRALERLHAEQPEQSVVAVLVGNVDRGAELPPNEKFAQFMAHELGAWIQAQVPAASRRAQDWTISGVSYGGLASTWLAFRFPERFGNVLSLSGSYWWVPEEEESGPSNPDAGQPHDDWLTRQIAAAPRKPIRLYIDAGRLESGVDGEAGILDNNRRLRDVLRAKGYPFTYHESLGGHDAMVWQDALESGFRHFLVETASPSP
ncbi:alpha/beta hydrolase-fold protein [Lampropedia puyangensis]|uniref:alpha/beta hydrolase-fold protein n=1 Tax=Lampropedia puyangensis TaxID=1330072 RepID=UPI001B86BA79|nr:alpha/beta hydrolase-fold protein [Lampropedia puyangensis]